VADSEPITRESSIEADAGAPIDSTLVGFVAAAGAEIDQLFRTAMGACARLSW
jgi:hypothetical protein